MANVKTELNWGEWLGFSVPQLDDRLLDVVNGCGAKFNRLVYIVEH